MTSPRPTATSARQHAEMTFKFNRHMGRHGWLRLTPAYSVKLVTDIFARADTGTKVLDPFSGAGTTPLCAAYQGRDGTGVEINPFLIWLGNTKLATYRDETVLAAREAFTTILQQIGAEAADPAPAPPMHNVQRWWNPEPLDFLCRYKSSLDRLAPDDSDMRDLLLVVFCRLVIRLSNAAFNHQSMSFKDRAGKRTGDRRQGMLFPCEPDLEAIALAESQPVFDAAADNPLGRGVVLPGDSRSVSSSVRGRYDLLVTSPPYPNRMSYIRELRPYMYWLGYLETGRDAGEMDWSAIGGTWGIATSRLAEWKRSRQGFYPGYFEVLLSKISHARNKSAVLLSNYVAKYFEDIWRHIRDVYTVMSHGGRVHYIVGNSTFYDVLVPVERLYRDMLLEAGFSDARIARIRKRNSKKELYEFDVSATK